MPTKDVLGLARVTPARAPRQVEEMTNATGGVSVARIDLKGHGPRNGGRIAVWLLPAPSGHPVTADATARRMFTLQLAQERLRAIANCECERMGAYIQLYYYICSYSLAFTTACRRLRFVTASESERALTGPGRAGAQVLHTQPFWMAMTRCSCTVLHCGQAGLAARRAQLAVEMEANRMHFDTEWINVFSEAAWQAGRAAATPPATAPAPAPASSEGLGEPRVSLE